MIVPNTPATFEGSVSHEPVLVGRYGTRCTVLRYINTDEGFGRLYKIRFISDGAEAIAFEDELVVDS